MLTRSMCRSIGLPVAILHVSSSPPLQFCSQTAAGTDYPLEAAAAVRGLNEWKEKKSSEHSRCRQENRVEMKERS